MTTPGVGAAVPPLEQHITTDLMMAYGAATWDWHRMHYDQDYARSLGFPGPVLDGQAQGAFFARAVMDWLGPTAFICKLSFRMRAMVFPGDTIRCEGEVRELAGDGDANLVTIAQTLKVGGRLVGEADTVVRLPRRV
jgi:acyl dehydratase